MTNNTCPNCGVGACFYCTPAPGRPGTTKYYLARVDTRWDVHPAEPKLEIVAYNGPDEIFMRDMQRMVAKHLAAVKLLDDEAEYRIGIRTAWDLMQARRRRK